MKQTPVAVLRPPHHDVQRSPVGCRSPSCCWALFAFPDARLLVSLGGCGETILRAEQHWTQDQAAFKGGGVILESIQWLYNLKQRC